MLPALPALPIHYRTSACNNIDLNSSNSAPYQSSCTGSTTRYCDANPYQPSYQFELISVYQRELVSMQMMIWK
ncbi:hypothetical protein TRVA0_015S01794 [Trichomonascus vanleenenianus]|uniref:uncharacterized protein n=1 Tax=Trichomonascus vanleenenianus TaxID=2268995 RepID=UPI003EC96CDA